MRDDSSIVHGEVTPLLLSSASKMDDGDGISIANAKYPRRGGAGTGTGDGDDDDDFGVNPPNHARWGGGGHRSSARLLFESVLEYHRRPSVRSEGRRRTNVVLASLLFVTASSLIGLVVYHGYYVRVYLPKAEGERLRESILRHAADARRRAELCKGVDWETACSRLTGASARRRRRSRSLYTGDADRTSEMFDVDDVDSRLLDSDDPSVTYDNHCLLVYRMRLFGNITFPYHASRRLDSGGEHTMALLIQHGAMRNSEEYFCSFERLMRMQGYRDFRDVLLIAPDFNYEHDDLVHPNDVFWNSTKPWGDWRVGAESDPNCCGNSGRGGVGRVAAGGGGARGSSRTFSSYEVLDHILAKLTNRRLFPKMNKISYVGHSAGKRA